MAVVVTRKLHAATAARECSKTQRVLVSAAEGASHGNNPMGSPERNTIVRDLCDAIFIAPPQEAASCLKEAAGHSRASKSCGEGEEEEGEGDDSCNTRPELDTWTWMIDMTGANLTDAPSWQVLRKMDDMLFAHYPGRLAKAVFVNMSGETGVELPPLPSTLLVVLMMPCRQDLGDA